MREGRMQEELEKERRRRGGSMLRWMMHSERRFYMTIAVCAVVLFLVQVWFFYRPAEADVTSVPKHRPRANVPPLDPSRNFTVVITTYKRQDLWRRVLEQYCSIPEVDQVLLVWNNLDLVEFPAPDPNSFNCVAPTKVLLQTENQVQNRLLQAQHIRTPGIFQVDDDMLIAPEDIQLAFHIWKGDMDRMVGFQGRRHYYDGKKWVYSFNCREGHSIVTGAAHFIHRRFYEMYAADSDISNQLRAFVTGGGCCDDIAMNALVSYTTGKGPVWVKAPYSTIKTSTAGGWAGKSAQSGWMLKRGGAVGKYVEIFGEVPFKLSDIVVVRTHNERGHWHDFSGALQDWWAAIW